MNESGQRLQRPLPSLREADTRDFWSATGRRELCYQQCDACDRIVFYPRSHCTGCTGGRLSWRVSKGLGTIYSYSVVRQSYHPFFKKLLPYVVAWVDLDEGPRLVSNLVGIGETGRDIGIGQKVAVEWEEHEGLSIPLFRPVEALKPAG